MFSQWVNLSFAVLSAAATSSLSLLLIVPHIDTPHTLAAVDLLRRVREAKSGRMVDVSIVVTGENGLQEEPMQALRGMLCGQGK